MSSRVCDWTVCTLAVWTVSCHVTLVLGGSLVYLIVVFALLSVSTFLISRRIPTYESDPAATKLEPDNTRVDASHTRLVLPVMAVVGVSVATYVDTVYTQPLAYWWTTVAVLTIAGVLIFRQFQNTPPQDEAESNSLSEFALAGIGLLSAAVMLFVHVAPPDDVFYISLSRWTADNPLAPIMSQDPIHGVAGWPVLNPAHRLSTHEMAAAAISFVSRIPVLYLYHWVVASLVAVLATFACARFLRMLTPGWWLVALVALFIMLFASGDTARFHGRYFWTRPWHGKSILLMVIFPLIVCYAVAFMRRPTPRGWFMLVLAHIAALGMSTTAIFTAPVLATLSAVAAASRIDRRTAGRVVLVMISSAYILIAAIALRSQMSYIAKPLDEAVSGQSEFGAYSRHENPGDWLSDSITHSYGEERLRIVAMLAIGMAWVCCTPASFARRLFIVVPLGVLLTLLNPYLERDIVARVTAGVHWRTLWIVPVPFMLALALTAPMNMKRFGVLLSTLLVAIYVVAVPWRSVLGVNFRETLRVPAAKCDADALDAAQTINSLVGNGDLVIASPAVSQILPQLHAGAVPLVPRREYLNYTLSARGLMTDMEIARRLTIANYLETNPRRRLDAFPVVVSETTTVFTEALSDANIRAVCIDRIHPLHTYIALALGANGFRPDWENETYEIWLRVDSATTP